MEKCCQKPRRIALPSTAGPSREPTSIVVAWRRQLAHRHQCFQNLANRGGVAQAVHVFSLRACRGTFFGTSTTVGQANSQNKWGVIVTPDLSWPLGTPHGFPYTVNIENRRRRYLCAVILTSMKVISTSAIVVIETSYIHKYMKLKRKIPGTNPEYLPAQRLYNGELR